MSPRVLSPVILVALLSAACTGVSLPVATSGTPAAASGPLGAVGAGPLPPAPSPKPKATPTPDPGEATPAPESTPTSGATAAPAADATAAPTPTPAPTATPIPFSAVSTVAGQMTTLSGSGEPGIGSMTAGERTPAFLDGVGVGARHNLPDGLAIDGSGNVFVFDGRIGVIRRVTPAAVVRYMAGGHPLEVKEAEDDDDLVTPKTATEAQQDIREDLDDIHGPNEDGTWTGFISNADGRASRFGAGGAMAFDSQNRLYVADTYNHSIRLVDLGVGDSAVVSTPYGTNAVGLTNAAGNAARFRSPRGIAVDASVNPPVIYVADTHNHCIRRIDGAGNVSTWAGSGVAGFADGNGTAARFNSPVGLALDRSGNLYVADTSNNRIRRIDPARNVSTVAGGNRGYRDGTGIHAQFWHPLGLALDRQGMLFVADELNHRIRRVTPQGVVTTVAGSGSAGFQDGNALSAQLNHPAGLAFDPSGNLVITDSFNHRVRVLVR